MRSLVRLLIVLACVAPLSAACKVVEPVREVDRAHDVGSVDDAFDPGDGEKSLVVEDESAEQLLLEEASGDDGLDEAAPGTSEQEARQEPLATEAGEEEQGESAASRADGADMEPGGHEVPVPLPPGGTAMGVTRLEPSPLGEGMDYDAPAVAACESGKVMVSFVSRGNDDTETLMLRVADEPLGELGPPRGISAGARAWNPRMAAGPDGSVWAAWCGREEPDEPGDHQRSVYLRRVAPEPLGEILLVAGGPERHCDPAIDVGPDGIVHLAWEAEDRIAYRRFGADGEPVSEMEVVSGGPLDRRPAVLAAGDHVHVAWDRLDPVVRPGAFDPSYDVLMRSRPLSREDDEPESVGFGTIVEVDPGMGIRAAPALLASSDGGVIVAYHSSDRHPLVKWWRLRRVGADGAIGELKFEDAAGERKPEGEQQGAELPAAAMGPGGRIAIVSRPSQGAFLHLVGADGAGPPLDLTRHGWGARGARARVAFAPDGTLLVVRRARHLAVLERFTFDEPGAGEPPFEQVAERRGEMPAHDSWRGEAGRTRPVDTEVIGPDAPDRRVVLGDVHMHSALSDGTGPADEVYARARVRGMDFAVLTDHDYIVGSRMFPSKHAEIAWVTDWFDGLEGFATLHGFEWTTPPLPRGHGHRNVYFRGHPMMPQPGSRDGYPDTRALHEALRGEEAFTAAHHTAWTGTDWENLEPSVQRHVEIVSVHGAFEQKAMEEVPIEPRGDHEDGLVVHGLAEGHVFGFLGGSDAHGLLYHHGLGRRIDPWDHGLTGVVVSELSRSAVWDALHARLAYATSGAPMVLQVSVSGLVMGREGRIGAWPHSERERKRVEGPPLVRWSYETTADPRYLMIFRDGEMVHREDLEERAGSGSWRDDGDLSVRHVYYVRLVQGEGAGGVDVAWSSPIFVEMRTR